ncbi:MAG TPA: tetratricopeptide repeat protein [Thermomicrobiales bacterium]|nr:tetratricopeptide repeat protein [Thermomicrobiales bacterium]
MNRAQLAFSLLALLVVFTLVVGALGTAIVDGLTGSSNNEEPTPLDENTTDEDEYETTLRQKVADNPNDAAATALLANYLAQTGRLAEAIPFYEKALELEPESWTVRLDFARSLADGGKRVDAEFQFKMIVAGNPGDPQGHYYYAELLRNWVPPRIPDAAFEYRRTIEVGSGSFVAELAARALQDLGYASPEAEATPQPTKAEATP